jgi:hypothetical protein
MMSFPAGAWTSSFQAELIAIKWALNDAANQSNVESESPPITSTADNLQACKTTTIPGSDRQSDTSTRPQSSDEPDPERIRIISDCDPLLPSVCDVPPEAVALLDEGLEVWRHPGFRILSGLRAPHIDLGR